MKGIALPILVALLLIVLVFDWTSAGSSEHLVDTEDNDFAEFEDEFEEQPKRPASNRAGSGPAKAKSKVVDDDDDEVETVVASQPKVVMAPEAAAAAKQSESTAEEDDATVEEEEEEEGEEFEHLIDEDEFEGFDRERPTKSKSHEQPPDLKITKVPIHMHTNWDSFYIEMLMLAGLGAYLLNFLAGKTKNNKLAQAWLTAHRQLLEENFHIVGDDGTSPEVQSGVMMKEAENIYCLWCSGRTCCEGMLVTIKLLKRQDLVSSIARMFRPINDQIIIKVMMDDSDMDTFVFCLANKRMCARLQKDYADISNFCPDKKGVDKFDLPSTFQLMSESGEVTSYILDPKMVQAIKKFESMIEYIHFSDQYTGPRQPDDSDKTKSVDTQKVLIFCFNVVDKGQSSPRDMEAMKPLLQMVFHCMDKMKRFNLSKEAKAKADRSRQKMVDSLEKASHAQRSEAAQARREEKRRAEKEKMMSEEDPEKQRKLEEKNLKKDQKKLGPKMKRMKIKAM